MAAHPSPASPPAAAEASVYQEVGKLHHLGPQHRWQVALLLPLRHEDLREPFRTVEEANGQDRALLRLTPRGNIRTAFDKAPRTTLAVADVTDEPFRATIFGDTQQWSQRMATAEPGYFLCRVDTYNGQLSLRIHEEVEADWVGRMRPIYPGKPSVISAEDVRRKVTQWLPEAIPIAAKFIESELAPVGSRQEILMGLGVGHWTIETLLLEAHQPSSPRLGELARGAVLRLAALAGLYRAHAGNAIPTPAQPWKLTSLGRRAQALPFALTDEQRNAVRAIAADLAQPVAMRHLLVGDVGSGKTACFGLVVAATVDAGGRAAILLPSQVLAEQVARELGTWWPDLAPVLVTGDADGTDLTQARLVVGTTALLHRDTGAFDLVVVDEEQKFSVQQREQLAGYSGHLLSASATCIPRSQALAQFGAVSVSELRENHTPKSIETRLWTSQDRSELSNDLRAYVRAGNKLLIVYPLKDDAADGDEDQAPSAGTPWSVANAFKLWDGLYPGKVRALTGNDDDEVKTRIITEMREGQAQILLATSLVETGMNLPGLRRVMVVMPERFGLTQLHQLRGRAARNGGEGFCDLYAPTALSPKARDRLTQFLACRTGFEVAELDLKLRGCGDLGRGATKQSGADDTLLYGSPLTVDLLEAVRPLWESLRKGGVKARLSGTH